MGSERSKSYAALEELIPKKLWILQYTKKRTTSWYARIYTGNRKYAERSLKTEDKKVAAQKAFEVFAEVITQVKATGSASPKTIRTLCAKWLKRQEDRNAGGELSTTLYRAHRHLFETYVPHYAEYKGWRLIKHIPHDGWIGYRKWRMEEGWKLIGLNEKGEIRKSANHQRKPPMDSTVNREVTMIQEWFKYLLVPEGLVTAAPVIAKVKAGRTDPTKKRNKPFNNSDYIKIQRRFRKWSEDKNAQKPEWRKVVYLFFLISANVGWRPDSEGLDFTWDRVKVRKRTTRLPNGEDKDEWISNLQIWDRKNKREREGNFLGGEYFLRLKELYEDFLKKNPNAYKPSRNSLVFADPMTGKRLSYTTITDAYGDILESLQLKGVYTFYSCRSFYVNERLKEGVEVFTVAKQTGHSMAICNQYYAQLDIQSRADEATRRTYGKVKPDEGEPLF